MDYKNSAEQILVHVGGKENIENLVHCATRLRFALKDGIKFEAEEIKNIKGVMGAIFTGGQYQVIVGSDVGKVYTEIVKLAGLEEKDALDTVEKDDFKGQDKQGIMANIMDTISSLFTPVVGAITGAAMIKVLLIILTMTGLMSSSGQTYSILGFVADTPFYFLPVYLAYTASKRFGLEPMIGLTIGLFMIHPTYMDLISAGESVKLFGVLPVTLAKYTSTVIPIILVIWVASYVQKLADKISPKVIKSFFRPMLTLLIMVPIAFCIVGPLGNLAGKGLEALLSVLQIQAPWVLPIFFGALAPIVIMLGMHYAVTIPLVMSAIAAFGFDMLGAGFLVANIAQGAAALAVAILAKNKDVKSLATSVGVTAVLGTTEPALYGVNLKYKKPLIATIIGGGIAGIFCGITGVKRIVFGPTGLTSIAIFIDPDNKWNFICALIGIAISFIVTFIVSYILVKKDKKIMQDIA